MRFVPLFLLFNFFTNVSAHDWSDTMDMSASGFFMFKDSSSGLVGYKQNDKIILAPKFEDGYNFHGEFAAAKISGKWGIIDKKGKWKIKPTLDLISPVVNENYISYKDSIFTICNLNGTKIEQGGFLKTDYLKYMRLLKLSFDPDRELVIRVVQMYPPDGAHGRHEDPGITYGMLSRYLIRFFWSTKWVMTEGQTE